MKYKGFEILQSNSRGGKAGRGRNRTASLQVREPLPVGYLLRKQIRYVVGSSMSYLKAEHKAIQFVDRLVAEPKRPTRIFTPGTEVVAVDDIKVYTDVIPKGTKGLVITGLPDCEAVRLKFDGLHPFIGSVREIRATGGRSGPTAEEYREAEIQLALLHANIITCAHCGWPVWQDTTCRCGHLTR